MVRKILAIVTAISLNLLPICAYAVQVPAQEEVIIAEGMAAGKSMQSHDEALNRALRAAVEKGVGILVDSETLVQNFQLLDDKIFSSVKGYVRQYEVLEETNDGTVWKVKVKATVVLGNLKNDIQGLGLIREKKDNPRVMVIVDEYVDGAEQPTNIVQTQVEQKFLTKNFPVVDKAQMEMVKQRDAMLNFDDPKKAAALGSQYGAEVVIVGRASANLVDSSKPYGVSVFAYEAEVDLRAIRVDTATIMAVNSEKSIARAGGRVPAANKALEQTALTATENMFGKIVEAWRSEVYNKISIQLVSSNADYYKSQILQKALKGIRSVQGVRERSLIGDILILDVDFFGSPEQFTAVLDELSEVKLKIVSKSPNRIEVKILDTE